MDIDWEVEELACFACGKTQDETDQIINDQGVDDLLIEKYGIDFETYLSIVKDLLPLTPTITTAMTGTTCHAFIRGNEIIVKVPAK